MLDFAPSPRPIAVRAAALLIVLAAAPAGAAPPHLVKDVWPGIFGSDPSRLTPLGDLLVFTANEGAAGEEPWVTDGTAAGTIRLRDVRVGPNGSDISGGFAVYDGHAYFNPFEGDPGRKLWRTDGTPSGTAMFYDFGSGSTFGNPSSMSVHDGRLYFFAQWGSSSKLSLTDGTVAGTIPVQANPAGGLPQSNGTLPVADNMVFFIGRSDLGATRAWRSDGTTSGTFELPGTYYPGFNGAGGGGSCVAGADGLYFSAGWGDFPGNEPWFSDGTLAGTHRIIDICPGGCSSHPRSFAATSEGVFFNAENPATGRELWITDGTAAGTRQVEDATPGPASTDSGGAMECGTTIFILGEAPGTGTELRAYDASSGTTRLVKDIRPGAASSDIAQRACVDGTLMFFANDGSSGQELWRSDGTPGGTVLVADVCPGACSSVVPGTWLVVHDDILYLGLQDPAHGREIWSSDGSAAGTAVLADVNPGTGGSWPGPVVFVGDRAYFSATLPASGTELWTFDVEDEPPVIHPPADASIECPSPATGPGSLEEWLAGATASDGCGDAEVRHELVRRDTGCGRTWAEIHAFWAVDRCGLESARVERAFTVIDTTPPHLASLLPPTNLWPPDHGHRIAEVAALASAHDACGDANLQIVRCASNQPEDAPEGRDGNGDGQTLNDCIVALDGSRIALRAERLGSCGHRSAREYSVDIVATDECGNTASQRVSFSVTHERPMGPALGSDSAGGGDVPFAFDPSRTTYGDGCP